MNKIVNISKRLVTNQVNSTRMKVTRNTIPIRKEIIGFQIDITFLKNNITGLQKEITELKNPNFTLTDCSLEEFFTLSEACSSFIGVDSGLRYFPLHYGKPTYVFSKYCREPFNAAPSHTLRWLVFEKYVLPMHHDLKAVSEIVINSTLHPASSLFPQFGNTPQNAIIERKYV